MKRYKLILGIILVTIIETAPLKCKAQTQIPLDWETTRGFGISYDFSQEYFGSIFYSETPYQGKGLYYHSFGYGAPRHFAKIRYMASVPDTIITKLTVINGDTIQFNYMQFNRDTIITDYSYGYVYYEPGINLGRYITLSSKIGLSFSRSEEVISGTPAYTSEITITTTSSYHHESSSSSGNPSKKQSEFRMGILFSPRIIGHIPISDDKRLVLNVGYNFFIIPYQSLETPFKPNGLSAGIGFEFVLD